MTDTIFKPEENCADYRLVVVTTSTAQANGYDTNSAIAQLSLNGQQLQGYLVSFALSGDARFTNGAQHISVNTDSQGEAVVFFTDTRPETVVITCNYNEIQSCGSVRFDNNPLADVGISGSVLQNNAPADGVSRNAMRYRVFQGGAAVPGIALAFTVDEEAMLIPPVGPWVTDDNGLYDLGVTKGTPGQVLVRAQVPSAPGADNNTFLNFVPVPVPPVAEYVLSYIVTRNNAPADFIERNDITFNLTLRGVGVANRLLSITADSSFVDIYQFNPYTNGGNNVVNVRSLIHGPVVITAAVHSIPSLLPVQVTLNFTEVTRRYSIVPQVIRDRSPAGGIPNQVRYTVLSLADGSPQEGVQLWFEVSGEGRPSPTRGATLMDGTFTLDIFRNFVGMVRVTARVVGEPLAASNVDVTFT
ncbi:Ig-like domain-containing protein [Sodalis ligni]|jgi:hypothetical protein|uniref:Big-1 domain-containing protein n=1 Tax=Sodalis ligni TaxID=2697027 RepID=A0A4R1NFX6_9GAMM|nr:Ig-like domain-containing protein [Sodalis ligni]TCL05849.1 hypothetical protein EZJ58_4071 [Sodalis ligni]